VLLVIEIFRGDITGLAVDAIVNAANERLRGGGGLDGAVHLAAGPELLVELQQYARCLTGHAVITAGHRLPAAHILHAVGPSWAGGEKGEPELLRSAYESCFSLAREHKLRTLAFPAISTGIFGYPKRPAAEIAVATMRAHEKEFEKIIACLFDDDTERIYRELLGA
jgi:O-acetyl-ADP-ribose deacetylase (regulator of RNase III)